MAKKKESIPKDEISKQIAETKKVLADAQKSLAEKTAEVSDLKAKLKQLEKSSSLPEDTKTYEGKWFKTEDGTSADENCKQYYYVIKDHGYKQYNDGSVYRKLTLFDLNMDLWGSKDLCNDILIYREISKLFDPGELDSLIPVNPNEIKKNVLKEFFGIFKFLNDQNILPEAFKPFVARKVKKKPS